MADPIPGGVPTLAGLRLAVQQAQWTTLADLLKPGALLTARVGDSVGDNLWQLQVAGRSVVAESPIPLTTGTAIRVEVVAGGEVPQLRLLPGDGGANAAPTRADVAVQLAQLGLPDEPAAHTALSAFTAAGAPLTPARLAEATAALRADPGNAALASAYATVARSGLPAMPLTIDLALRAALPQPPSTVAVATAPASATGAPLPTGVTVATAPPATMAPVIAAPIPLNVVLPNTNAMQAPELAAQSDSPEAAALALHRAGLRSVSDKTASDGAATASQAQAPITDADDQPPIARLAHTLMQHSQAGTPSPELRAALVDSAAHTVFPPAELVDYDLVLPLPLQERGQPVPARLAVSTRRSGSGAAATWLRVDTELSNLGPVSARLASADAGPLVVHLVAGEQAQAALAAVLPDLEAALAAKGFTASVRLSVDHG